MLTHEQIQQISLRIGFDVAQVSSISLIEALNRKLIAAFPFENLDVLAGKKIKDDSESVFEKLVMSRRGGMCFELNTLLLDILSYLGFESYRIEAQMVVDGDIRDEANHVALILVVNHRKYLLDIGDARGMAGVMALDGSNAYTQQGVYYKVVLVGENQYQLRYKHKGVETIRYQFRDIAIPRENFARAKSFIESSPDSIFTKQLVITKTVGDCRYSLTNEHFVKITAAQIEPIVTSYPEQARSQYLERYFGIIVA